MASVDDDATNLEALHRQTSLQNQATKAAAEKLAPTGRCYSPWCRAPVQPGELFCDSDCCHDYEDAKAAAKRNGRT